MADASGYYVEEQAQQTSRRGLAALITPVVLIVICIFGCIVIAIVLGLIPLYLQANGTGGGTTTTTIAPASSVAGNTNTQNVVNMGTVVFNANGRSLLDWAMGRSSSGCGTGSNAQIGQAYDKIEAGFRSNNCPFSALYGNPTRQGVCRLDAISGNWKYDLYAGFSLISSTIFVDEVHTNAGIVIVSEITVTTVILEGIFGTAFSAIENVYSTEQFFGCNGEATDGNGNQNIYSDCGYNHNTVNATSCLTTNTGVTVGASGRVANQFYWN